MRAVSLSWIRMPHRATSRLQRMVGFPNLPRAVADWSVSIVNPEGDLQFHVEAVTIGSWNILPNRRCQGRRDLGNLLLP